MKIIKNSFATFLSCLILLITVNTYATEITIDEDTPTDDTIYYSGTTTPPTLEATAAILVDNDTGRILYSKNSSERIFPASITKLLTTMIATEYIKEDDVIVVGDEIELVPWDSSKSGHIVGESILGLNLYRGLLIPSGNDTSNVVALHVARLYKNDPELPFDEAEVVFAEMMNKKAKELGANNSNFVSPHGYHDDNHYSTVEDLITITMAALENPTIKRIVKEYDFKGNGAGDKRTVNMTTQEYEWVNTNRLLGGTYYYRYATGVKTGYTSQAGRCLVSSATNENENLISIVLGCEENEQFTESKKLLEFGFNNYNIETLQEKSAVRKEVYLDNPQLGEDNILQLLNTDTVSKLLSAEEVDQIKSELVIHPEFISNKLTDDGDITLKSDILEGTEIATVSYSLDDNIIYKGSLVAANDVYPRTLSSDFSYYMDKIKSVMFSWLAIPILISIGMISLFVINTVNQIKAKNRKKNRHRYGSKDKYRFKDKI